MKKTLSILLSVILLLIISVVAYGEDVSITAENNIVTVNNAPAGSTIITAFYKNQVLSAVKLYKGGGTFTADISEEVKNSDMAKMFLWDMKTIRPLSTSISLDGGGKSVFNFETKSVLLNSGYEMPINGLGTYSLHGETCINVVKSALANGVRLIDTASAYGNEAEIGQAIREAMEEYGIKREEIFVTTKIYPGSEMANPEQSIQACIDRLNIGYFYFHRVCALVKERRLCFHAL